MTYVDYETQKRYPKESAKFYTKVRHGVIFQTYVSFKNLNPYS